MLYSLSDLRDPLAFLSGARVPIAFVPFEGEVLKDDVRIEWSADRMFCAGDDGCAQTLRHEIELPLLSFAIDLSNPDVARWVDRKIADHVNAGPVVAASIERVDGIFSLCYMGRNGQYTEFPLRPANNLECLRGITTTEANIPTARAALLRTLFGKVPA